MKKKYWGALIVLVLSAGIFLSIWQLTRPETASGEKQIAVQVVHSDETVKQFNITTNCAYLGAVLVEAEIVEDNQGTYGLYILTADGETVDESEQEWWCLTKDGESLTVGASEVAIKDGDRYELTFTVGYGG